MSAQPSKPSSSPDLMSVAMATPDPGMQREGLGLPALRIGLVGGLTAMLCCVGPTLLAMVGVASAATAYAWAETLYGSFAWAFRVFGFIVVSALVVVALRRRHRCTLRGLRAARRSLLVVVLIGGVTYGALDALTTWLGGVAVR